MWAVYYKQIRKSEQRPPLHLRAADLSNLVRGCRPLEQPPRAAEEGTKFSNCHGQLEKKRAGGRDDRDRNSILGTAFSGVSSVRRTAAQSVPAGSGGGAGIKS